MARLVYSHVPERVAVAAHASNHTALLRVEAPAHQKVLVRFHVYGRGSASNPPVQYTVRRASATTGGTTSALTAIKRSGVDAETVQASVKKWTAQPTDVSSTNGSTIASASRLPSEAVVLGPYLVNGGESLTLWGQVATTAADADVIAECEE